MASLNSRISETAINNGENIETANLNSGISGTAINNGENIELEGNKIRFVNHYEKMKFKR